MSFYRLVSLSAFTIALSVPALASAQVVETVGTRALGMGGAFVAVASDSSAVWWNPAGLASGPFFDMAIGQIREEAADALPAGRHRATGFSAAIPPIGFSYYRFRLTDIQPFRPTTERSTDDREDRRAGVPVRSLAVSQVGVTVVHMLVPGVHAGATMKYVRGAVHTGGEGSLASPSDLLDRGDELDTAGSSGAFDIDAGVLAVAGLMRVGVRVGNVLEPEFGDTRLPRQFRVGVAFDSEPAWDVPLTIALDADVREYDVLTGPRRVIATGAEYWLFKKRLGVRGGGRFNTVGAEERIGSAGATVALRPGMFIEGHVSRGSASESGWGLVARVSF